MPGALVGERQVHDCGNTDAARALLQPVYEGFTEGHDVPDMQQARALLGVLRG